MTIYTARTRTKQTLYHTRVLRSEMPYFVFMLLLFVVLFIQGIIVVTKLLYKIYICSLVICTTLTYFHRGSLYQQCRHYRVWSWEHSLGSRGTWELIVQWSDRDQDCDRTHGPLPGTNSYLVVIKENTIIKRYKVIYIIMPIFLIGDIATKVLHKIYKRGKFILEHAH